MQFYDITILIFGLSERDGLILDQCASPYFRQHNIEEKQGIFNLFYRLFTRLLFLYYFDSKQRSDEKIFYENKRQFTKQRTNEIKAFFMGSLLSEMRIDIILYFHRINN